jgi:predicted O-methyltransferase YrrM
MIHLVRASQVVDRRFKGPISAVEIGSIRSRNEGTLSTLHIVRNLKLGSHVTSVDISPEAIEIAKEVCDGYPNIEWVRSDGADFLKTLKASSFQLLLLDGAEDPEVTLREFMIGFPKLANGGICIVDNSGIKTDGSGIQPNTSVKGHLVWKYCVENRIGYEILPTEGVNQLRIDKIEMDR